MPADNSGKALPVAGKNYRRALAWLWINNRSLLSVRQETTVVYCTKTTVVYLRGLLFHEFQFFYDIGSAAQFVDAP